MFRMTPPAKPGAVPAFHPGWQKIVDVRTGKVQDVPAAEVPSQPNRQTHPMVRPQWPADYLDVGRQGRPGESRCRAALDAGELRAPRVPQEAAMYGHQRNEKGQVTVSEAQHSKFMFSLIRAMSARFGMVIRNRIELSTSAFQD